METPPQPPAPIAYFREIAGLRLYLALWVAVGHALELAGYGLAPNRVTGVLLRNDVAVYIFMIVSGFVITNLLLTAGEPYGRYIVRRFFRLYPAYLIGCVVGFVLIGPWAGLMHRLPWSGAPGWAPYMASVDGLSAAAHEQFLPHFLLHATMLHGLAPQEWLARSPLVFLPAAWSVSLEWQFYLVAPLLLLLGRSRAGLAVLAVVIGAAFLLFQSGRLGHYEDASTLAGAAIYFVIGIVSRLLVPRLRTLHFDPLVAALCAAVATRILVADALPIGLWLAFYCFLLWERRGGVAGAAFRLVFGSRPLVFLGECSYSLYLIHRPLQVAFALAAVGAIAITPATMLGVQLAATLVGLPVSIAMWFAVERPAIRFARRLVGASRARPIEQAVAAAP